MLMVSMGFFFLCHWIKDHQDQNLSLALKNVEEANSVKNKKQKQITLTGYILWLCSVWNTQGCGGTVITTFMTYSLTFKIAVWYKNHREALGLTSGTLYWLRPKFSSVADLLSRRTTAGGLMEVLMMSLLPGNTFMMSFCKTFPSVGLFQVICDFCKCHERDTRAVEFLRIHIMALVLPWHWSDSAIWAVVFENIHPWCTVEQLWSLLLYH